MKKFLFIGLSIVAAGLVSSCGAESAAFWQGAAQGYNEGSQNRRIIGSASSESQCISMARSAGCGDSYVWYTSTNNCFCK